MAEEADSKSDDRRYSPHWRTASRKQFILCHARMKIHPWFRTSETPLRIHVALPPGIRLHAAMKLHGTFKSATSGDGCRLMKQERSGSELLPRSIRWSRKCAGSWKSISLSAFETATRYTWFQSLRGPPPPPPTIPMELRGNFDSANSRYCAN